MANPNYDPDMPDGPFNDPGPPATYQEAAHEYCRNVGSEDPDREWILSPYDTWETEPLLYRQARSPPGR